MASKDDDTNMDTEDDIDENNSSNQIQLSKKVYLPGEKLNEDEELVCDESAYIMYHQAQTEDPCLSFDILQDDVGDNRQDFPMTCYTAAGTQSQRGNSNSIIIMKMGNLCKTQKEKKDEEDEEEESDSDDEDELPEMETALVKHTGCINRIRTVMLGNKHYAATWSENGKVYIWDLSRPLNAVNDSSVMTVYTRNEESPLPVFEFAGHQIEGFALDWCRTTEGRLATGDCKKNIHLWNPREGGTWSIDQRPYTAHTDSVEDIQWSPNENNVFASCSVDRTVRIWDARVAPNKACMLTVKDAHTKDVNVIHWNRSDPFILSGGDDGCLKVWDLRELKHGKPAAMFKHHTAPITSVEWHPTDSSVFAASGADDQITIWDLSVERDTEMAETSEPEPDVPPQLLFIHQGQKDIKELHWHSQLTGVIMSTANSGFNVFRTISV